MSIFFENDYDDLLNSIVNKDINPAHVYETIYDLVIKNKDWVLYGDHPKESKEKVMDKLIGWFEKTEEYEKCQNLKKIKDKI